MKRKKLLVVDDHKGVREATRRAFEDDFEIFEAADQKEALRAYDIQCPDVVFLDIELNGLPEGWEILREIRLREKQAVVILVTGLQRAERHPLFSFADGYFQKPTDLKDMQRLLKEKGLLPLREGLN